MISDHLRAVVERLAVLPEDVQEAYAEQLESNLHERERIATQLADPNATDLECLLEQARQQIEAGQVNDLDEIL